MRLSTTLNIYIAGPLFTEGEVKQRLHEGKLIKEQLKKQGFELEGLFNPIEAPYNDKANSSPTSEEIFIGDYDRIKEADVVFIDISNEDSGTMVELGHILTLNKLDHDIKLFAVSSDIRFNGEISQGHRAQIGHNQYVVGGILEGGNKIYPTFDEALKDFTKYLMSL